MRRTPFAAIVVLVGMSCAALADSTTEKFHVEKDQIEEGGALRDRISLERRAGSSGQHTLYISQPFRIMTPDGRPAILGPEYHIRVWENGRRVLDLGIQPPSTAEPLTAIMAIDISGSMAEDHKIDEAKQAARLFLDRLNPKSRSGLILFDHKLRAEAPPSDDRQQLRTLIEDARPSGGTAYLDATARAIAMLRPVPGRKAVLLMTDGVDLNSEHTLASVVQLARKAEVPVYTVGVGRPGEPTPVTTVLTLDCSGSMTEPADDSDQISKMEALHKAATRYVDIMRAGARMTLLPFSDEPTTPEPFSDDKVALKQAISRLDAGGQTALFDSIYDAVRTLNAAHPEGKQAVVVLTDGIDNRSHRRVQEVIRAARQARIPVHLIGLGKKGELDEEVMQRIGRETEGSYQHASNEQALFEIFEKLSIDLHDNGVDEAALTELAQKTGGKYKSAKDISQLQFIYQGLAEELQTTYVATFPSLEQSNDGTSRRIEISVFEGEVEVSNRLREGYNVSGVVVPDMDTRVYLGVLVVLCGLLVLPACLRRFLRDRSAGVPS
jgi:VWFA-related protein